MNTYDKNRLIEEIEAIEDEKLLDIIYLFLKKFSRGNAATE